MNRQAALERTLIDGMAADARYRAVLPCLAAVQALSGPCRSCGSSRGGAATDAYRGVKLCVLGLAPERVKALKALLGVDSIRVDYGSGGRPAVAVL